MKTSELGPDDAPRRGEFWIQTAHGRSQKRGLVGRRWAISDEARVVTHLESGLASPPMLACVEYPVALLIALDGCVPWDGVAPMPDDVRAVFDRFGMVVAK